MKANGLCKVPNCKRRVVAKSLCMTHYQQVRRFKLRVPKVEKAPPRCSYPGCGRDHLSQGYCRLHWERVRRTGSPDRSPRVTAAFVCESV